MTIAMQTLEELSQDPAARRLACEREDSIKLYKTNPAASKARGWEEGKAEGQVQGQGSVLLKLLPLRFGPLPEPAEALVCTAASQQLDAWVERVVAATTLAQVFTA